MQRDVGLNECEEGSSPINMHSFVSVRTAAVHDDDDDIKQSQANKSDLLCCSMTLQRERESPPEL